LGLASEPIRFRLVGLEQGLDLGHDVLGDEPAAGIEVEVAQTGSKPDPG
jgi:hypothetical protein